MAATFDFDEILMRKGSGSLKWDSATAPEVLPMWIADMDFKTAPAITAGLVKKASEGIFGYPSIPAAFNEAIITWWEKQHSLNVANPWIIPTAGTEHGISAAIKAICLPGNGVIVQTPVYNHFFTLIENCDCKVVTNPLINTNGNYEIDFDDLAQKAADPNTSLLLLCNPHNPIGRVWQKAELEQLALICTQHQVAVISDEVYADLSQHQHTPFLSLSASAQLRSVICSSPGKAFNLSGLKVGYVLCPDQPLRENIAKNLAQAGNDSISTFGTTALIAAYHHGEDWLKALKDYLQANFNYLKQFLNQRLPALKFSPLQASYLVWLDCRSLGKTSAKLQEELLTKHQLWVNAGSLYGIQGEGFLRLNIACPRVVLQTGLKRLVDGLKTSVGDAT